MSSPVILISSDSSAQSSPVHGINSMDTSDCDERDPDSDARSDSTVDYYMPINVRKPTESDHNSCESSLSNVNSSTNMECIEVQLSDSNAGSDTPVDNYPPVNFKNQLPSKTKSQECDISGNCAAGVSNTEMQLLDYEGSDDRWYTDCVSFRLCIRRGIELLK
jgi:hypothetical protein